LLEKHPLARQWRDEWELLGLLASPALKSLVRAVSPAGMTDSRMFMERG
jgi:hypothetical protein